jgi:nitrate/nitrite-specific signal transduction histidine kinase
MLRRKLMARLGPLVLAFVAATVIAVMMLQSVLQDLAHLTLDTASVVDGVYELGTTVAGIQLRIVSGGPEHADDLAALAEEARRLFEGLAGSDLVAGAESPAGDEYRRVAELMPAFLASARSPARGRAPTEADAQLSEAIAGLAVAARQHILAERIAVRARLRHIVVGIAVVALIMLNAAVLLLLHVSSMVLRPVDDLIEATRQISQERFDYRVRLERGDEFDQLAESYNAMAGQLALNEQRKMETLQQVAVALNHDLNNVLGIITLQLTKVGRQSEDNPALRQQLQLVQGNLSRMAETIQSLSRIRRIVLTEYLPGKQMLDLPRSLEPTPERQREARADGSPP